MMIMGDHRLAVCLRQPSPTRDASGIPPLDGTQRKVERNNVIRVVRPAGEFFVKMLVSEINAKIAPFSHLTQTTSHPMGGVNLSVRLFVTNPWLLAP